MVALKFLHTAVLFALYTTTTAQISCSTTNAIPVESLNTGSGGSSGGSGSGSGNYGAGDIDFSLDLQNSLNDATRNGANLIAGSVGKVRRQTTGLVCTASEVCMSLSKMPFCVNPKTGDYHMPGEKGNIVSGDFVLDNGKKGNLYKTTSASPTGAQTTRLNAAGITPTAPPGAATTTPPGTTPTNRSSNGGIVNTASFGAIMLALAMGLISQ